MRSFETVPLLLTPLTPIHVGCGIDFEPTNYVIDDGVLFHFDPADVRLDTAELERLKKAVDARGDEAIRNVQRFFYERRERYAAASRRTVAVAPGIAEQYAKRVGQVAQHETGGKRVTNQLDIERTAHHSHSGEAYLPGSSIKGAIRTAWLDGINRGQAREERERPADLESRLLGGSFQSDPFRLVRLADATGKNVLTKIVFSTNHKKRQVFKNNLEVPGKGPIARRETIVGGQYRALGSEIRFDSLGGMFDKGRTPLQEKRVSSFSALAAACNRFYRKRLELELDVIKNRRFATEEWVAGVHQLLQDLRPALDEGRAMLLRVGRHSGAESVTLEGVRSIKIMKGPGQQPSYSPESTTLWLAAEREGDRCELLPFGWLLVELADDSEIIALKSWCEAQSKPDLAHIHARLAEARKAMAAEIAEREQQCRDRAAREAEEQRLKDEREARRASLSEEGRLIEELSEKLAKHTGRKQPVSGALYAEVQKVLKLALQETWSDSDKRALADLIAGAAFEKIDFGGKAREIKRVIASLRGDA